MGASLVFVYLFNPVTGPINQFLGHLGLNQPLWFFDPTWAKPALLILGLWGIGDAIVLYLAGLLNVPRDLYEAIAIEGANAWQRFRYVTLADAHAGDLLHADHRDHRRLPVLRPGLRQRHDRRRRRRLTRRTRCCSTRSGSTSRPSRYFHMGYASAMAWVLFVATMVLTAVLLLTSRRWVHYGGGLS